MQFIGMMSDKWIYLVSGTVASVTAVVLVKRLLRTEPVWPEDTVVIHHIGRAPWAPCIGPFAFKLETYMRIAKIPYVNHFVTYFGPKHKIPWITYNGTVVPDSQFSIEYIKKELGIDLNRHLTTEQKAVARAFQRLNEDNLFWTTFMWFLYYGNDHVRYKVMAPYVHSTFGPFMYRFLRWILWKNAYGHGMGRHSVEEVLQISEENLKAISDYLDTKKFLMGDVPSEVDCSIFGTLGQFVWHMPGSPLEHLVCEKYPNLRDYCYRMKDAFWPDWDDCITHGFTKKATK